MHIPHTPRCYRDTTASGVETCSDWTRFWPRRLRSCWLGEARPEDWVHASQGGTNGRIILRSYDCSRPEERALRNGNIAIHSLTGCFREFTEAGSTRNAEHTMMKHFQLRTKCSPLLQCSHMCAGHKLRQSPGPFSLGLPPKA